MKPRVQTEQKYSREQKPRTFPTNNPSRRWCVRCGMWREHKGGSCVKCGNIYGKYW